MLTEAERVARTLLRQFTPGEHAAICAANCPEWMLVEFGAALAGLVLVAVNEGAFITNETRAARPSERGAASAIRRHERRYVA